MANENPKLKNKRTAALALAAAFALLAPRAGTAMEIPLDKADSQIKKVAYINMHKVFEAFPDTEKARTSLHQMIDEKKAEISARKEEIAKLKGEVDFLRKQMSAVEPSTPKERPAPQAEPEPAPEASTGLVLPEGSPMKFLFSPPEDAPNAEKEAAKPPVQISSNAPSILPGIPSPAPQLGDKESLLNRKQADLEAFIGASEAEIKRLEEGQTMTLMARIYKAIEDVSAKGGYAMVIDREDLLYGDQAVDITQQVIWKLSAPALPGKGTPQ
jgi:Skp family chaperone for outer membrane proteins